MSIKAPGEESGSRNRRNVLDLYPQPPGPVHISPTPRDGRAGQAGLTPAAFLEKNELKGFRLNARPFYHRADRHERFGMRGRVVDNPNVGGNKLSRFGIGASGGEGYEAMKLLQCSLAGAFSCTMLPLLFVTAAQADLRVCNKTPSRVGIAIGYKAERDWTTEGWWTVEADSCATLLPGPLVSRFYYMYAVDYQQGGEWGGNTAFLCTREKEFTIEGTSDCVARGYQKTGFYEIDTGTQESWTIQLTEPTSRGVGGK